MTTKQSKTLKLQLPVSGAGNSARKTNAQRPASTRKSAKRRQGGKGRPFQPGNEYAFPSGQSGNPNGRAGCLSTAARAFLERVNDEDVEFESVYGYKRTNAEILVAATGSQVLAGNTAAFSALLKASEGDKLKIESDDSLLLVKVDR